MSMTARNLKDNVTHWAASPSTYGGFTFDTPVTFKGRWEDKAVLFRDTTGSEVTSESVVSLAQDVSVGDFIFLGESEVADPTTISATKQVRQFSKIPDLRHIEYVRKAFL